MTTSASDKCSIAIVSEADTWDPSTNTLRFAAGEYGSEWSYNGDNMNLTVASPYSYHLRLTGAEQVMYAKDKLGIKGFIQEGAQEDRSSNLRMGPIINKDLAAGGRQDCVVSATPG